MRALFWEEVLFAVKVCRERENATIISSGLKPIGRAFVSDPDPQTTTIRQPRSPVVISAKIERKQV
jgi:hypothetical protein